MKVTSQMRSRGPLVGPSKEHGKDSTVKIH